MLLLLDNYDSFTYNLYQYLCELGQDVEVVRNDQTSVDEIEVIDPQGIVISPGPSRPENAGISCDVARQLGPKYPLLGVCLGHQCIGHAFGGRVGRAQEVMHGKSSFIHHKGLGVLEGLADPFEAIRYHSLAVMPDSVPDCLEVTAWTDDGTVMAVRHREHCVEGVQFHPESIMTGVGKDVLRNFLRYLPEKEGR
jgi:anthranilate synthase/aminodeoxychorismate synthase-like glutamine amidotransferase